MTKKTEEDKKMTDKKIFCIQWRHENFGWNTVYVLADDKKEALEQARKNSQKDTPQNYWDVITGYNPHIIKSGNVLHCSPDPEV